MRIKSVVCTILFLIFVPFDIFASGVALLEEQQVLGMSGGSAQSCVTYCLDTDEVIYGTNEHLKLPMASTTKIMTAIIVLENTDTDEVVSIPDSAVGVEGSSAYLMKGERLSVTELLYGLMLESANDAAVALAIITGGDVDNFVALMNEKAESIGMKDTHFANPHGLDDEEHYSTSYDMALLCDYAMKNERFVEISGTYRYETENRLFVNHNRLLKSYEGIISGKTGYTRRSGRCLVSVARRNGVTMCVVTLNDPNDWQDHKCLYDVAFDTYECREFDHTELTVPVISGQTGELIAFSKETSIVVRKGSEPIELRVYRDRFIYAPVKKGDVIGYISYCVGDKELAREELIAASDIHRIKKRTFIERFLLFIFQD